MAWWNSLAVERNFWNIFLIRKKKVTWQLGQTVCQACLMQADICDQLVSTHINSIILAGLPLSNESLTWILSRGDAEGGKKAKGTSVWAFLWVLVAMRYLFCMFIGVWAIYLLFPFTTLPDPSLPIQIHIIIIVSRTWGAMEVIMSFYLHPAWPFLQTTCHWLPSRLGPDDIFWSGLSRTISGEWQVMDTQWQTKSPGGQRVGRTCQVSIRLASQWGCLLTVPPGPKSDHGCLEIGC